MDQPVRDSKVDLLSTRNLDFHQRQIKNAAPAVDDFDYVILKQIKDLINGITSNAQGTNQSVITTVGGGSFIVPGSDSFLIYNRLGNAGADPNLTWAYNGQRLDIVGIKDMMTLHVENGYIGSDGGFNTTSTSEAAVNVPNGTVLGNYITTKNAVEFVGITQPPVDLDGRGDAVLIYDKDANQLMVSYDTAPYVPLGGGGGSAVGVKGTIQLSDGSGHFAGDSHFTYDTTSGVLAIQENHALFPDSGVIAPIFNATGDADGYIFQAYIPGQPDGFQYPIMMNTAGDIAALGRIISNAFEYDGNTTPPPISLTRAVVYYDTPSNALLVSYNGAPYVPFGGGVSVGVNYAIQLSDGNKKFKADNNFTYDIVHGTLYVPNNDILSGVDAPIFNARGTSNTGLAFQCPGTSINISGDMSTGRIIANSTRFNTVQYTWPSTTPAANLVLTTNDATGTLKWAAASSTITAPGSDTWVIFNDATVFGAVNEFTYNKNNKVLSVGQATKAVGSGVVACLFNSTATSGSSFTCANGVYGVNYLGGAKFLNLGTVGFASFNGGASAALNPTFPVEICNQGNAANLYLSGVAPNMYLANISGVTPQGGAGILCSAFLGLATAPGHYGVNQGDLIISTQSWASGNGSAIRIMLANNNAGGYSQTAYFTTTGFYSSAQLAIYGNAGTYRQLVYTTGSSTRWLLWVDNGAESGANAGSNWGINRYDDSGNYLGTPIQINRATGLVTIANLSATIVAPGQNTWVFYNASGAFGASANFAYNSVSSVLVIGPPDTPGSGIISTVFNSSATGTHEAFQCNAGVYNIIGSGDVHMRTYTATQGLGNTWVSIGLNPGAFASGGLTYGGIYYDNVNATLIMSCLSGGVAWRNIALAYGGGAVGVGMFPVYNFDVAGVSAANQFVFKDVNNANSNIWQHYHTGGVLYYYYLGNDVLHMNSVNFLVTAPVGFVSPNYNSTAAVNATAQAFQTQSGNFVVFGDGHVICSKIYTNSLRVNDPTTALDLSHAWIIDSSSDIMAIKNYAGAVLVNFYASGGAVNFNYTISTPVLYLYNGVHSTQINVDANNAINIINYAATTIVNFQTLGGPTTFYYGITSQAVITGNAGFAGTVFNAAQVAENPVASVFQCGSGGRYGIQSNGNCNFFSITTGTLQVNGSATATGYFNGVYMNAQSYFLCQSIAGITGVIKDFNGINHNVTGGIITS